MKKYKARVKSIISIEYTQYIDVEATSEDEAMDNASETIDKLDSFDWIDKAIKQPIHDIDHTVEDVEEIL